MTPSTLSRCARICWPRRKACEKHGCPLEFILKDISTVRYEPERLSKWAEVAMQVAGG